MAFSVAPTLGMVRLISVPRRPLVRQRRSPPFSRMSAPSRRSAARWRSMGRGPSSQPPGAQSLASPVRARTAPKKMTEDRISRMRWSGMSQRSSVLESTVTVWPSLLTRQPRCSKIATVASTSDSRGQLCITLTLPERMVAARMGSTLFFAPWTWTAPSSLLPPEMMISLIVLPPHSFVSYYEGEEKNVITPKFSLH